MYRNDNPLCYRRNAISIAPETVRNGPGPVDRKSSDNIMPSRLMSITDDSSDPRLRKILSRLSVNTDDEGNNGAPNSRLTHAQIHGTKKMHVFLSRFVRTCFICL